MRCFLRKLAFCLAGGVAACESPEGGSSEDFAEAEAEEEDVNEEIVSGAESSLHAPGETPRNSCESYCDEECVFYARCKKPDLPKELFTYEDKVDIINSYTPEAGSVAVIKTNQVWGHVAYVEKVDGMNITISESNWIAGQCSWRTGTMESLNITGFFR